MKIRLVWHNLRSTLWFRPALWVVALGLLALGLIWVDQRVSGSDLQGILPWLFIYGIEGARTMLGAVGSGMLTVTTLTFSIIMLAVVQTANAYSPRILREYLADTDNQHVLGILIGTYLYTLLILRVVRDVDEEPFVPTISISVALLLSLVSIIAFIYFINHVAHSIEVGSIVTRLRNESRPLLEPLFPGGIGEPWQGSSPPPLPDEVPACLRAERSGYLEVIMGEPLLEAATRADVLVRLERGIGEYVLAGTPLLSIWPAEALDESLEEQLREAISQNKERTMVQDLHYGVRQLSDIALRALAPSTNDPSTAINCIDVLAALLVEMAQQERPSSYRCNKAGQVRLIAHGPTFETILDQAFNPIRHYGASDLTCITRLIRVCGEIGHVARRPEERQALCRHLAMGARAADRSIVEPEERILLNQWIREAARNLDQAPEPFLLVR